MRYLSRRSSANFSVLIGLLALSTGCGKDPAKAATEGDRWPLRSSQFTSAAGYYGELRVTEGEFEFESKTKPWSSWWFPMRDTYLFQSEGNRVSPLEKYDRYYQKVKGSASSAAAYERENLYDPNANSWEGLCNAWAVASIMEPEPTKPVSAGGITFGVGDLKALLVKSYEQLDGMKSFGQRYNGDRNSDFNDMYPEQFHRVLKGELLDRGRPFIIDKDPGVPVWNTPVWKAQVKISKDASDSGIFHVTTWLFGASPFVDSYDYVGTLSVVFEYTYDLMGTLQGDGSLLVSYGSWTGASQDFHPDFATVLPENNSKAGRASNNKKLDVSVIDQIAGN